MTERKISQIHLFHIQFTWFITDASIQAHTPKIKSSFS